MAELAFVNPGYFQFRTFLNAIFLGGNILVKKLFPFDYIWQLEVWVIRLFYLTIIPWPRGTNISKVSVCVCVCVCVCVDVKGGTHSLYYLLQQNEILTFLLLSIIQNSATKQLSQNGIPVCFIHNV